MKYISVDTLLYYYLSTKKLFYNVILHINMWITLNLKATINTQC